MGKPPGRREGRGGIPPIQGTLFSTHRNPASGTTLISRASPGDTVDNLPGVSPTAPGASRWESPPQLQGTLSTTFSREHSHRPLLAVPGGRAPGEKVGKGRDPAGRPAAARRTPPTGGEPVTDTGSGKDTDIFTDPNTVTEPSHNLSSRSSERSERVRGPPPPTGNTGCRCRPGKRSVPFSVGARARDRVGARVGARVRGRVRVRKTGVSLSPGARDRVGVCAHAPVLSVSLFASVRDAGTKECPFLLGARKKRVSLSLVPVPATVSGSVSVAVFEPVSGSVAASGSVPARPLTGDGGGARSVGTGPVSSAPSPGGRDSPTGRRARPAGWEPEGWRRPPRGSSPGAWPGRGPCRRPPGARWRWFRSRGRWPPRYSRSAAVPR